ncbi:MAG: metallophosphoesterase, partial [Saprospiraceae bacterium]|nr:metallophosphoesterase [Saprospiraceae bacterium]MDW8484223.1 metallophosphoesterase [Saprospiraceae bacterium]
MRQSRIFFAFCLLLLFSCRSAKTGGGKDDGIIEVVFLHLNDVYEISPLSDDSGGLARVAAIRQSLKAKNPNTYTLLAGDFISPSVIATLRHEGKRIRGRHMVDVLNTLGVDAVIFGNHEFDYDYEDLQARLNESDFPWLGTNLRLVQGDSVVGPFFKQRPGGQREACPDYKIVEFTDADGTRLRVGLWGVTVTVNQKPYVRYENPLDAAQRMYEALRGQCDVQVGLTHLDIEDDLKLAARLPGVPLILGGHDHDNMLHKVGPTTVAKADANARTVYVHRLRYDKRKGTAQVRSELRRIDGSLPEEPNTASVVAKWEKIKEDALKSAGFDARAKVVSLTTPLDCREALIRHQQAPVGQIILEAMLAAAREKPECALLNSGSIRVD